MRVLLRDDLGRLVDALRTTGRRLVGPTVRDGAIVLAEVKSAADLPEGVGDAQAPGRYRLVARGDRRVFGHVVGPGTAKDHLLPSREALYRATRRPDGKVGFEAVKPSGEGLAFLGLRACDLAGMAVQDRVLIGGGRPEPRYAARREGALIVAVSCTEPGALCFCASTGTGPRAGEGADVVLTERDGDFLVEARTERGQALVAALPTAQATEADVSWADEAAREAARKMGRAMDTRGLPGLLYGRLDHARWAQVAERCLACGSCTSVCPTCFCSTGEVSSTLDGARAEHARVWESCFTYDHAAIHGSSFRPTVEHRYRQWLGHKLGAWVAQTGESGCVGCGRCIAWCPAGIDLTEEVAALREGDAPPATLPAAPLVTEQAADDLVPRPAEVVAVTREADDVVTLHVRAPGLAAHLPGQFDQLSLPGIGEAPISISGSDGVSVEHTIRAVGPLTRALCALRPGDELGLRGPYGQGWPLEALAGHPVVVVAGGIGLAPLRGALRQMLGQPDAYPLVRLFFGARSPGDVLYVHEMLGWVERPGFSLRVTVDRATPAWHGHVGVVTRLIREQTVPEGARALVCGPEVMMRFTVDALRAAQVPDEHIWVTMERHMRCATGTCGRCQLGPFFVCKDGPVFRFDRVRDLLAQEGF